MTDQDRFFNEARANADQIQKAYDEARTYYKGLRERFDHPLLHELASKPDAQGYLLDEDIIAKAASKVSHLKTLKNFFGADSAEYLLLKRNIMDNMMRQAPYSGGTDLVDGAGLYRQLRTMLPEMRKELLGPKEAEFMDLAKELGVFQGQLNPAEFQKAAERGPKGLEGYLQWRRAYDKEMALYNNSIIRAVTRSDTAMPMIEPGEFVEKFVYHTDPPMLAQVMGELSAKDPRLIEDIRAKVLEGIFNKMDTAKAAESLQQMGVRTMKDIRGLDPRALKKAVFRDERTTAQMAEVFGNLRNVQVALPPPGTQAHLKAVLGNDTLAALSDLGDVLAVDLQKEMVGRTVGGLTAGSIIANVNIPKMVTYRMIAKVLANPMLRKYVSTRISRPDATKLSQALIAAQPMLESASYTFASESGFMRWLQTIYEGSQATAGLAGEDVESTDPVSLEMETLR